MSATIFDGKAIADRVYKKVAADVAGLATTPGLAPSRSVMILPRQSVCATSENGGVEAGMRDTHRYLSGDVTQETAVAVIDELASDPDVTRILVQLPLPPHLNAAALIDPIRAGKDVDGPTETSEGRLALRRAGLRSCTPLRSNGALRRRGHRIGRRARRSRWTVVESQWPPLAPPIPVGASSSGRDPIRPNGHHIGAFTTGY
jgi:5,10-methylene-tetrahydrofolate dehydrogenase/methenyl tetrahydrofolate cyclohydrolase